MTTGDDLRKRISQMVTLMILSLLGNAFLVSQCRHLYVIYEQPLSDKFVLQGSVPVLKCATVDALHQGLLSRETGRDKTKAVSCPARQMITQMARQK